MTKQIKNPKVFISYSWTNKEHEERILEIAKRLLANGIAIILDKWDLKTGQDKYAFMEKMVTDDSVSKVLMFCDKQYQEKADNRKGGVGTEAQIISSEIYNEVDQEKFIPIVTELNDKNQPCLPTYLKSRMYIDFTKAVDFPSQYERLVRVILGKPEFIKPPMGEIPKHILNDKLETIKTTTTFQNWKDSIEGKSKLPNIMAYRFLEKLQSSLEEFRLDTSADESTFDEIVLQSIAKFLPYRNEFIEFVNDVCLSESNKKNIFDEIFSFLENCIKYFYPPEGMSSYKESWFDNYKFFLDELFLYLIAILIRNKEFDAIHLFLKEPYYTDTIHINKNLFYPSFNNHIWSFDELRNKRLQLKRTSVSVDILKERATNGLINFNNLMEADLVCSLRSVFPVNNNGHRYWFPRTLVYASGWRGQKLKLFQKASSKRNFNSLKQILNVESKEQLGEFYQHAIKTHRINEWRFGYHTIPFLQLINFEELDTIG